MNWRDLPLYPVWSQASEPASLQILDILSAELFFLENVVLPSVFFVFCWNVLSCFWKKNVFPSVCLLLRRKPKKLKPFWFVYWISLKKQKKTEGKRVVSNLWPEVIYLSSPCGPRLSWAELSWDELSWAELSWCQHWNLIVLALSSLQKATGTEEIRLVSNLRTK